jgi:hypothetical protein
VGSRRGRAREARFWVDPGNHDQKTAGGMTQLASLDVVSRKHHLMDTSTISACAGEITLAIDYICTVAKQEIDWFLANRCMHA